MGKWLDKFIDHNKKSAALGHASSMLNWDSSVNMPNGGAVARNESLSQLSVMMHQMKTAKELPELIAGARLEIPSENFSEDKKSWWNKNLDLTEKSYKVATLYSDDFVARESQAGLDSEVQWRTLRAQNNWHDFAPYLEKVVEIVKEGAQIKADAFKQTPYNALLDQYERDLKEEDFAPIFSELKEKLPDLIQTVIEKQKSQNIPNLDGNYPTDKQKALGLELMKLIQFDFDHGRLDVSLHPFCGGVSSDVRMTTRYDEKDFSGSLMGVLHETGHGKYEQNLPRAWNAFAIGHAPGMIVHESQSLFMEMQIARSTEFIKLIYPIIKKHLNTTFSIEDLQKNYKKVEAGFIRVDADELTYPMHVILRYELEKAMISGDLIVRDLPGAWNEKMQKYLGLVTLGNDKNGCMQDIHWPSGGFGYFPCYTLGAVMAAQLKAGVLKAVPKMREQILEGNFTQVDGWLDTHVWSRGGFNNYQELLEQATGSKLQLNDYFAHLKARYL
jgi:carboxypeptidase Taq